MKKYIIMSLLIIVLASCQSIAAPAAKIHYPDKSMTFKMSYDSIWDRIINWCAVNKIDVKCVDKSSGLINAEFDLNDIKDDKYSDYIDIDGMHSINNCVVNIYILIKPKNNNTEVDIISHCEGTQIAKRYFGKQVQTNNIKVNCQSTGKLEKEIFDFINY